MGSAVHSKKIIQSHIIFFMKKNLSKPLTSWMLSRVVRLSLISSKYLSLVLLKIFSCEENNKTEGVKKMLIIHTVKIGLKAHSAGCFYLRATDGAVRHTDWKSAKQKANPFANSILIPIVWRSFILVWSNNNYQQCKILSIKCMRQVERRNMIVLWFGFVSIFLILI